jgi:hypothetical protein
MTETEPEKTEPDAGEDEKNFGDEGAGKGDEDDAPNGAV